jgi:hypothetical protein
MQHQLQKLYPIQCKRQQRGWIRSSRPNLLRCRKGCQGIGRSQGFLHSLLLELDRGSTGPSERINGTHVNTISTGFSLGANTNPNESSLVSYSGCFGVGSIVLIAVSSTEVAFHLVRLGSSTDQLVTRLNGNHRSNLKRQPQQSQTRHSSRHQG